ncbi:hypothetical protein N7532_006251 [Penicillium argentinense]|uniref:MACPF domain-containing protein n=1 Tax=Penicillium argentinense TaxID=1131581 RepID=A0A9W9FFQ9_9EURO|nr:uncharacterized protein N7532_006251 [Penicillium argentinense]KAJ5099250.1 hypothetical protein N7532_006251 [Penicillium argentinense]
MARSSFSSIEAEASVREGGAFGFSAAVSAGFSQSENNALSTQNTVDTSTMNITYNFPRVVLYLDQFGVDLSQECASDLAGVKDASSLIAFHHKYGHFFATRIELGGRLFSSEKFSALGSKTQDEAATAMKIAAAASFSSSYVSGNVSYGQEKQTNAQNSSSNRAMQSSISWQAQGGDTLLCNNPPAWCPTVAPSQNWRVIKQEDVTPLGDFIGQIPGYEDIPEKFKRIAEVTRKKEVVSFRISLQEYQRADSKKPEYLSLHHAWKISKLPLMPTMTVDRRLTFLKEGEVEEALSGEKETTFGITRFPLAWMSEILNPPADGFSTLIQNVSIPDTILDIYNNGYPCLSMETNSLENVFDIEVETLLNQAPTVSFPPNRHKHNTNGSWQIEFKKRYHIYNRKRGLWLRAFTVTLKGKEITLLAAGPKSQATLFEFRDKSREGPVRNGDSCSLVVYGRDGRQKGSIAHALESHGTSIGAMPYSVDNERWLRFTNLSILDQRDVPT